MSTTDKLGLNVISEDDDMPVSEFIQALSGAKQGSNMEILDEAVYAVQTAISNIDPDSSIRTAGGITAWISANYENAEVSSY